MGKKNQKKKNPATPSAQQTSGEKMKETIESKLEDKVEQKIETIKEVKEEKKEQEQPLKSTQDIASTTNSTVVEDKKVDDVADAMADFAGMLGDDSDEQLKVQPKKQEKKEESKTVVKDEKVEDIADAMADFAGMLGDESDEDTKKTEPKKVDSKPLAESEFEKIDVSQTKETPTKKSVVVNENHIQQSNDSSPKKRPNLVGIKSFTDGTAEEVESPMRKKKRHLGQLTMKKEVCESPKKFENLERKFAQVSINFTSLKKEFEKLKNLNKPDLLKLRNEKKLQSISQEWQKSLEMQLPESDPGSHEDLVEFNLLKEKELKEMEHFIQILNEWVEESLQELESEPFPAEKKRPSINKESSKQLASANEVTQNRLQAQSQAQLLAQKQKSMVLETKKKQEEDENSKLMSQLDSLAQDDDLMQGLQELEAQEKKDIQYKKSIPQASPRPPQEDKTEVKAPPKKVKEEVKAPAKPPSPKKKANDGMVQGQGSTVDVKVEAKEEIDPNKGDNESNFGMISVVAALIIAGGVIAYRTYAKK